MALSSLRNLLAGSTVNRPGVRRSIHAAMIVEAANRIIPGHLSGMTFQEVEAVSFKDGVLRVRAKSAAARYGMKRVEAEILARLRQDFPTCSISRIQFFLSKEPSRYEFP